MILQIQGVSVRFGDRVVLDTVDAEAPSGVAVALLGANGAGKTTLANVITGQLRPDSGRVLLRGVELVGRLPEEIASRRVARLFQGDQLAWNLTALENVLTAMDTPATQESIAATYRRLTSRNDDTDERERAHALLDRLNLRDQSAVPARRLSFGQRRLLALARVLARQADVLVLDEPFSGLKSAVLDRVLEALRTEVSSGRLLLIIDHFLPAVRNLTTTAWFIHQGRLTIHDSFDALWQAPVYGQVLAAGAPVSATPRSPHLSVPLQASRPRLLTVDGIRASYGGRDVLCGASLELERGEVLGIVGINGAGKSTFLRVLSGLLPPDRGELLLFGRSILDLAAAERARAGIRFVPQENRIFNSLSVRDNLLVSRAGLSNERWWLPRGRGRTDLARRLAFAGNHAPNLGLKAQSLSGGEQAGLALDCLDASDACLVLLDEPTGGLDAAAKLRLARRIEALARDRVAIILVEHDLAFLLTVATRIAILQHGLITDLPPSSDLSPAEIARRLHEAHDPPEGREYREKKPSNAALEVS